MIQPKKNQAATTVLSQSVLSRRLRDADLTAEEEKVLRMRYGIPLGDDLPLGLATYQPEAVERLARIESAALTRMTGGLPRCVKDQIIERLRAKPR